MSEDLVCYCPSCGAAIRPVPEDTNPGDVYLCYASCFATSVLTDALTLRPATEADLSKFSSAELESLEAIQRCKPGRLPWYRRLFRQMQRVLPLR